MNNGKPDFSDEFKALPDQDKAAILTSILEDNARIERRIPQEQVVQAANEAAINPARLKEARDWYSRWGQSGRTVEYVLDVVKRQSRGKGVSPPGS